MNTKAKAPAPQQVEFAIKTVRDQIIKLGSRISRSSGEQREELEKEMVALTDSIGMSYVPGSTPAAPAATAEGEVAPDLEGTVGGAMLKAFNATNAKLAEETDIPTDTAAPAPALPSVWVRCGQFVGAHKVAIISTVGALLAAAAAAYYYLKGGTAPTVPAAGMADVGVETPVAETLLTRMGGWIVTAGSVAKGYAVMAWSFSKDCAVSSYNWVKGLFTKADDVVVTVAV